MFVDGTYNIYTQNVSLSLKHNGFPKNSTVGEKKPSMSQGLLSYCEIQPDQEMQVKIGNIVGKRGVRNMSPKKAHTIANSENSYVGMVGYHTYIFLYTDIYIYIFKKQKK
jgi:hypothetical protein